MHIRLFFAFCFGLITFNVNAVNENSCVKNLKGGQIVAFEKMLHGFEPQRINGKRLSLSQGTLTDIEQNIVLNHKKININTDVYGIDGVDNGLLENGASYHVFVLRDSRDCSLHAILSRQISVSKLSLPNHTKVLRKLPWGFVAIDGEIPAFHLSYWPKPFTRFTDVSTENKWMALDKGSNKEYTEIDFSKFIPENARLAYLMLEVDGQGEPGSALIRVSGSKGKGLRVGRSFGDVGTMVTLHQRISSSRKLMYKVTGGAVLTIYVLGYSNTEPS